MRKIARRIMLCLTALLFLFSLSGAEAASVTERTKGKIVLQVQSNGEAWYVSPVTGKRFYLKDGETAYSALRTFGLGIRNTDLSKIPVAIPAASSSLDTDGDGLPDVVEEALGTNSQNADSDHDGHSDLQEVKSGFNPLGPGKINIDQKLDKRLSGRILLQVQSLGQAWYVNPADGKRYFMKDGSDAYQIMRSLGLGISNSDLASIPVTTTGQNDALALLPPADAQPLDQPPQPDLPKTNEPPPKTAIAPPVITVTPAVRGVSGDGWADVVLGQKDFSTNVLLTADPATTDLAGGLTIERLPNGQDRLYIIDANRNRIFGLSQARTPNQTKPALIFGQSDVNGSACNGDATLEKGPLGFTASAATLCFSRSGGISPAETVEMLNLVTDTEGNLYAPDPFNNRILKYNKPFETDTVADEVWGQNGNFNATGCNAGGKSLSSLCLQFTMGIDIDGQGNLWATDGGNSRVLRFPKNQATGVISKTADLELPIDSPPTAVRVDNQGNVYVAEFGNADAVLVFSAGSLTHPATAVPRIILKQPPDQPEGSWLPDALAIDAGRNGLWIENDFSGGIYFYSFTEQKITKMIRGEGNIRGVDVDSQGNVFVDAAWEDDQISFVPAAVVDRATVDSPAMWNTNHVAIYRNFHVQNSPLQHTLSGISGVTGLTIAGNQLIVTDQLRALYWNDYHSLQTGQPADGEWNHGYYYINFGSPVADTSGRLWMTSRGRLLNYSISCDSWCVYAVRLPLMGTSPVIKSFSLANLQTKDGDSFDVDYPDFLNIQPIGDGDSMWVATNNHGVLRITNIDGKEDSGRGPYVDVVLGRSDLATPKTCPTANLTFICLAMNVRLDSQGNVWVVAQRPNEDLIGTYYLKYDASIIPIHPSTTQFGIAASSMVNCGCLTPAFDGHGRVAAVGNPYTSGSFDSAGHSIGNLPSLFSDESLAAKPQKLNDRVSMIQSDAFDPEGNLYLGDWNWNRILIYKKPLQ